MRTISPALASHLAGGVTTLCRCWRLTRRDGVVFGFTDHDRDLTFDGVTFAAASGLDASEAEASLGLSVGGGEVSGALTSLKINEADIAAGRYDSAEVASFLVNWSDVSQRLLLDVETIGEIRRADRSFVSELRGAMHRLDQEQGRLFQADCSADLGDARCGVALAGFTAAVTVGDTDGRLVFTATGLTGIAAHWYAGGMATVTSGANAGLQRQIRAQDSDGVIALWEPLPAELQAGDAVTLVAGCDKRFETCQAKFANAVRFRGFPHMPTPDFILTYARSGEGGYDGGPLNP